MNLRPDTGMLIYKKEIAESPGMKDDPVTDKMHMKIKNIYTRMQLFPCIHD